VLVFYIMGLDFKGLFLFFIVGVVGRLQFCLVGWVFYVWDFFLLVICWYLVKLLYLSSFGVYFMRQGLFQVALWSLRGFELGLALLFFGGLFFRLDFRRGMSFGLFS